MARPADPHAKDALVAAARAEFAKKGVRGARVEDITAACGLSKGAFYLHFESKEGLFKVLVDELMSQLGDCSQIRVQDMHRFIEENGGLTPRDFRENTARVRRFLEMECAEDMRVLEVMWRYRDVLDVLISGCQGTAFEGTLWQILDAELARINESHRTFQHNGVCRSDVPAELFGAMIVGTYLLVGKQMARAQEKPDLALWAQTLQRLIREGSLPRDASSHDETSVAASTKHPTQRRIARRTVRSSR
jgi:AcrR family transcriptional regulator